MIPISRDLLRGRINSNSRTGSFSLFGKKYFFKILKASDAVKEVNGYYAIRNYYPVPNLLKKFNFLGYGILVFSYESSVDLPGGKVVDFFSERQVNQSKIGEIFYLYKNVFLKTLVNAQGSSSNVFYHDRVSSRLVNWYPSPLLNSFEHKDTTINGLKIKFDPSLYVNESQNYFRKERMLPCVISQCDPQDLNWGSKPVIFDYQAGGLTPLMAEYASYLWFSIGMGNYLAPLLNPYSYTDAPEIFSALDQVAVDESNSQLEINHELSKRRQWAIREYTKIVIDPLTEKYQGWWHDLLPHLTMRALTVFNLSIPQNRNKLLFSLSYLGLFRQLESNTPNQFIERLLSIYK